MSGTKHSPMLPDEFIEELWGYAAEVPLEQHPWFDGILQHRWSRPDQSWPAAASFMVPLSENNHTLSPRGDPAKRLPAE